MRKIFIIIILFTLYSCKYGKVYVPNIKKNVTTVSEIEQSGGKIIFEQYLGYKLEIKDSILNYGYCNFDILINDVMNDNEIENYKKNEIQSISFFGSDFPKDRFINTYQLNLKLNSTQNKFKQYDVYRKNEKVGVLKINDKEYELIFYTK